MRHQYYGYWEDLFDEINKLIENSDLPNQIAERILFVVEQFGYAIISAFLSGKEIATHKKNEGESNGNNG